ncbi:Transcriptional regulator, MarR family [Arthrobacter sp. PAMC 25486]|uniref:MarR family winged helix-turn-helix transcriptional regulator n=1 Tax=Arthrobacter sp. PAMC 25486 TaxID=1494608 RepID=UPI000535C695|nr:MarR family transcriptional regulator [Arthrobacter sp. PAMC 25486]AIY01428.1 Transcriptional regulator, MarR family [Arthrobacter sp. PAMC 25486]
MSAQTESGDFVDRARQGWAQARPDLDVASIEVMGRIARIGALVNHRTERHLVPEGLTRAEFDVLCALARSGGPLRASEVTAVTMLSGASTTKNADRLAKRGLIERLPWEHDGRVVLMRLTRLGEELVDREFPRFLDRDREMLAGLTSREQAQLAALLRKIAVNVERSGV